MINRSQINGGLIADSSLLGVVGWRRSLSEGTTTAGARRDVWLGGKNVRCDLPDNAN